MSKDKFLFVFSPLFSIVLRKKEKGRFNTNEQRE